MLHGLWLRHSDLRLHLHTAFSSGSGPPPLSLTMALATGCRTILSRTISSQDPPLNYTCKYRFSTSGHIPRYHRPGFTHAFSGVTVQPTVDGVLSKIVSTQSHAAIAGPTEKLRLATVGFRFSLRPSCSCASWHKHPFSPGTEGSFSFMALEQRLGFKSHLNH